MLAVMSVLCLLVMSAGIIYPLMWRSSPYRAGYKLKLVQALQAEQEKSGQLQRDKDKAESEMGALELKVAVFHMSE